MDRDDPNHWFTAGEIANVAKAHSIRKFPTSESGVIRWIKRRIGQYPTEWRSLSRARQGQNGGGGTEYHWTLFSGAHTKHLSKVLEDEAFKRSPHSDKECWGETVLANLVWELYPEPGVISFSPEDEAMMQNMLNEIGQGELIPAHISGNSRKVRRSRVNISGRYYFSFALRKFEGERVAVSCWGHQGQRVAFVWRYNDQTGELDRHGTEGLICMIESLPKSRW